MLGFAILEHYYTTTTERVIVINDINKERTQHNLKVRVECKPPPKTMPGKVSVFENEICMPDIGYAFYAVIVKNFQYAKKTIPDPDKMTLRHFFFGGTHTIGTANRATRI